MQEKTLSKEAQNALWQMIRKTEGVTTADIAQVLGDVPNTISNYANINMPNHLPSLKKLEALLYYTRNPALLKVWANEIGYICIPADPKEATPRQIGVIESLLNVNIGSGLVNQHVLDAWEDGVITPAELADTANTLEKLEEHLRGLRTALESQSAKYLAGLEKEKA
ncbi:phage regulatory CII family protein [Acinetobacter gerneri]|jgi:transcriptional regulator with XRE-family HTH domain|uniref:phage regulatory CII family protein n=1 Tax=Acinetobacter gerneri TaxID=202952 RepID=UPI0023F41CA4|nr:phage regulatory CII family protein [Acinetobacter gerneri]MCH4245964.1 XRE family transcriptional regulator [Acinetobacter gerneri]